MMDQAAFEFGVWLMVAGICAPCIIGIVMALGYLRFLRKYPPIKIPMPIPYLSNDMPRRGQWTGQ